MAARARRAGPSSGPTTKKGRCHRGDSRSPTLLASEHAMREHRLRGGCATHRPVPGPGLQEPGRTGTHIHADGVDRLQGRNGRRGVRLNGPPMIGMAGPEPHDRDRPRKAPPFCCVNCRIAAPDRVFTHVQVFTAGRLLFIVEGASDGRGNECRTRHDLCNGWRRDNAGQPRASRWRSGTGRYTYATRPVPNRS